MKEVVYFLLLSIVKTSEILNSNKKRQLEEESAYSSCIRSNDEDGNIEAVLTCTLHSSGSYYVLPEDHLLSHLTKLSLKNDIFQTPTLIKKNNPFEQLSKLRYLFIDGYLQFQDKLLQPSTAQKLHEQFFYIPTLKKLYLKHCGFLNSLKSELDDTFALPPNISKLTLEECSDKYFDWKKTTTLKTLIIIQNSDLTKVPDLGYPSLEVLDLGESPILVSPKILAGFCNLTKYLFHAAIYNKKENYCECDRLWFLIRLLKQDNPNLGFRAIDTGLVCVKPDGVLPNCTSTTKYAPDELKTIRNKCLSLKKPENSDDSVHNVEANSKIAAPGPVPSSSKGLPLWLYIAIGLLAIIVSFFVIIATVLVVKKRRARVSDNDEEYVEEEEPETE